MAGRAWFAIAYRFGVGFTRKLLIEMNCADVMASHARADVGSGNEFDCSTRKINVHSTMRSWWSERIDLCCTFGSAVTLASRDLRRAGNRKAPAPTQVLEFWQHLDAIFSVDAKSFA